MISNPQKIRAKSPENKGQKEGGNKYVCNRKRTLVQLNVLGPLNDTRQLAIGTGLNLRHGEAAYRLILRFKLKLPNQCLPSSAWPDSLRHLDGKQ